MTPLNRLALGAIAGFAATLPMTYVMRRLHPRLPEPQRYPLPPREITEDLPQLGLSAPTATLLHHFLYGAAAGGIFALVTRRRDIGTGSLFGAGVWTASYLGWIPAAHILRPALSHPARRNALMMVAHLVWGTSLASGLRELEIARGESFSAASGAADLHDRAAARSPQSRP